MRGLKKIAGAIFLGSIALGSAQADDAGNFFDSVAVLREAKLAAARGDMEDASRLASDAKGALFLLCMKKDIQSCEKEFEALLLVALTDEALGRRSSAISSWEWLIKRAQHQGVRDLPWASAAVLRLKEGRAHSVAYVVSEYRPKFSPQEIESSRTRGDARKILRDAENARLNTAEGKAEIDRRFSALETELNALEKSSAEAAERLKSEKISAETQQLAEQKLNREKYDGSGNTALTAVLEGLNGALEQVAANNISRNAARQNANSAAAVEQPNRYVAGSSPVPSPQPMRQPSLPSSSYSPLPQQRAAPSASSTSSNRPAPVSRPVPLRQFIVRMSNRLNQGYSVWDVDITNPNGRALQCQVSVTGSTYGVAQPGRLGAPQGLANKIEQGDYFSPGATKRYSVVANGSPAWSVSGCN